MNQIDNHFSKKLRDLEVKPSDRANQLFNSKLAGKQSAKKPLWRYLAVAASFLIALGVLFSLYTNSNVLKTDTALIVPSPNENIGEQSISETTGPLANHVNEVKIQGSSPVFNGNLKTVLHKETVASNATERFEKVDLQAEETLKMAFKALKISPELNYKPLPSELMDYTMIDVYTDKIDLEKPIETKLPIIQTKEPPLLSKVINEVKYVVHGEKPDLDRAGIKPAATVMAYNQNGFIANESRQIKEGVNRFRGIFK